MGYPFMATMPNTKTNKKNKIMKNGLKFFVLSCHFKSVFL